MQSINNRDLLEIQIYMNVLGIFLKLEDFHHFGKKINTNQSHRAGNGRRPSILYLVHSFAHILVLIE